jgi:AcrR family transcriptional regulator
VATQERAIRTRQAVLEGAARVFEERGYQAATISEIITAADVTKGALYFHFESKEDLAQGVLAVQNQLPTVPDRASRIQQFVDVMMLHGYRLQTDLMVRAGARLSLDQQANDLDRSGPFRAWSEVGRELLEKARAQGELLPHVVPSETAAVAVGSFAGVQAMSQVMTNYQDLLQRVSELLRHLLPSVVLSSVLASIDLSASRGAAVHAELVAARERSAFS